MATKILVHGSGHKATSWDKIISYMGDNEDIVCPNLSSILGKDEVASSNLAISSKNRFSNEKRFFLLPAARVHGMPGEAGSPAAERQKAIC